MKSGPTRLGSRITPGDKLSAAVTGFEAHDGGVGVLTGQYPEKNLINPVFLEINEFLRYGSALLPGFMIGVNVVIAAGACVALDVPSNSVALGVPVRVVRASDECISKAVGREITRNWCHIVKRAPTTRYDR